MPDQDLIFHKEIIMWSEVIYEPYKKICTDISGRNSEEKKSYINLLARNFYSEIQRTRNLFTSPFKLEKEFENLSGEEKAFWYNYVSEIPKKLRELHLFIRPFNEFCRTCLIPDHDIEKLAGKDYDRLSHKGLINGNMPEKKSRLTPVRYHNLTRKRQNFYREMNYMIPVLMKRTGFEIIRPEEIVEINEKVTCKIAKAIHSRYLHEIRKQCHPQEKGLDLSGFFNSGRSVYSKLQDFDNLPDEIKYSNIDNAYHIPTKLLSVGYRTKPVTKGRKPLALQLSSEEIETMAMVEHLRWCWDKRLNGWIPGKTRNAKKKTHPGLVPYDKLSETEKEKDRELVRLIPALLNDIGYEVCPVNPGIVRKLSYAIKPHSSIHKILEETTEMNARIRRLVTLSPDVEKMVRIRNQKIENAIKEVEGNYNYARHIQKTFLPDDLYIRECFQESFVLFKPKDIVSGDFYFFSKQNNLIVFAAADCTGHGIPGALLSTLGYGIIDQAVNEIKLTDPPAILTHLYSRIHRFLRNDENGTGVSDDMDIALCTLDVRSNVLSYAGVMNPLYRVTNGELIEYKAGNSRDNCNQNGKCPFVSKMIQLNVGDTIYIFSDGYNHQFGGMNHKKYQSARFRSFIMSIQPFTMPEQGDRLNEEIEKWRDENNEDQTDDIVVIGIRI
jgi:serine phosphatase RsbU (regulator of sigma subunit)